MTESESKVVRVPKEVADGARLVSVLTGSSTPTVLADAWREYMASHAAEFGANFEEAGRLLQSGDTDALAAFTSRNAKHRGEVAAERIRKPKRKPFPDGGLNPRERREEAARIRSEQVGEGNDG